MEQENLPPEQIILSEEEKNKIFKEKYKKYIKSDKN